MLTVLITGGSKGIGFELARCFVRDGNRVVLVSSNKEHLLEAKYSLWYEFDVLVDIEEMDLSKKNASIALFEILKEKEIDVDVLVNNAGIGSNGYVFDQDVYQQEKLVSINNTVLVGLCTLYSKVFKDKGSGMIINIGSTGAYVQGPCIASYYASKAFVDSYTKALQIELEPFGIDVRQLIFGPTRTGFYESGGVKTPWFARDVESVVEKAYKQLSGSNKNIVVGIENKVTMVVPRSMKVALVKRLKRK